MNNCKQTVTWFFLMAWVGIFSLGTGCTPRVEVVAPEKPITINLNVKIDHEVRIKVEKELDQVLSENTELF